MKRSLSKNYLRRPFLLLFVAAAIGACKKDRLPAIDPQPVSTAGVYVLCEGAFSSGGKSSISYYNVATGDAEPDYFKKQNGVDLGTNANDLKQYGSKMYCLITGSNSVSKDSFIEVISIATGKSIKRIPFFDDKNDFSPRYISFYKNKAYVSGYDGHISKIDTASLNIESRIEVGGALEGLAIVNGKLYVANSLHPDFLNSNNASISVVDLNSFKKVTEIPVSLNPTKISATSKGDLFVVTRGSWNPFVKSAVEKLNSITDTKIKTLDYDLNSIVIAADKGYVITGDYPAGLKKFNVATGEISTNFITDDTKVTSIYGVTVNPLTNDVYVADATNFSGDGKFFCFGADGKKKFEFTTGTSPQSAVFKYNYN